MTPVLGWCTGDAAKGSGSGMQSFIDAETGMIFLIAAL
jgi:hypothetical protein